MQIAPAPTPSAGPAAAAATPPVIQNVHVSTMRAGDLPGRTEMTTVYAPFVVDPDATFTGHVSRTTFVDGRAAGISLRAFVQDAAERAAAAALLDAIEGSGLLELPLRELDWRNPEPGRTRIYVDRRQRFLEFDTAAPPAEARAVLQAMDAWEQVARR